MKKLVLSILAALMLSGCFSLPDVGNVSLGDKIGKSVASSLGMDKLAVQMQAMQFYSLYFAYAFYGGFSYETGFEEGQGVRWAYTTKDNDGNTSRSEYERVFLKTLDDKTSWWRLTVESEGESMEYEYQMNDQSDFIKIRFKDPDTGEIVEYIPEQSEEEPVDESSSEMESDTEYEGDVTEEEYDEYNSYEYSQYSMGEEKITVGAGTFRAEHMVSEVKDSSDPENPVDIRSDWWIVETVPGGVVQYLWVDNIKKGEMKSELIALLANQTTKFKSY